MRSSEQRERDTAIDLAPVCASVERRSHAVAAEGVLELLGAHEAVAGKDQAHRELAEEDGGAEQEGQGSLLLHQRGRELAREVRLKSSRLGAGIASEEGGAHVIGLGSLGAAKQSVDQIAPVALYS